ncbi:MAG: hypothetical protein RIC89_07610, partial [Pseudomonadales bacterium]
MSMFNERWLAIARVLVFSVACVAILLATPAGSLGWYLLAATSLVLACLRAQILTSLILTAIALCLHLFLGVWRAGAFSFSHAEAIDLASYALLAFVGIFFASAARDSRRLVFVGLWLLSVLAVLFALTGQRHAFHPVQRQSLYIDMTDGMHIAADI